MGALYEGGSRIYYSSLKRRASSAILTLSLEGGDRSMGTGSFIGAYVIGE
jgi:hypothetical protein